MPIKQVTCCICQKLVNKAQTLSLGNDKRACRSHPNVQQEAQKAQNKIKVEQNKRTERLRSNKRRRESEFETDLRPKCFTCGCLGMPNAKFFWTILKGMERWRMQRGTEPNVFKDLPEACPELQGVACLWNVAYNENYRYHNRLMKETAQAIGFATICDECCKKQKIEVGVGLDKVEDLSHWMTVFDFAIKPVLQEEVIKELNQEQK